MFISAVAISTGQGTGFVGVGKSLQHGSRRTAPKHISKALLNNTLTLSTFAYADVKDLGVFNRFSADWAATDQIHVLLGYDLFYAESGIFLTYAHNSEVWLKLKYSF